jgi:hypothetical protein
MVLIVAPQHEAGNERGYQQGPADRSGDAMYAGAKQVATQSEGRRPDNSACSVASAASLASLRLEPSRSSARRVMASSASIRQITWHVRR